VKAFREIAQMDEILRKCCENLGKLTLWKGTHNFLAKVGWWIEKSWRIGSQVFLQRMDNGWAWKCEEMGPTSPKKVGQWMNTQQSCSNFFKKLTLCINPTNCPAIPSSIVPISSSVQLSKVTTIFFIHHQTLAKFKKTFYTSWYLKLWLFGEWISSKDHTSVEWVLETGLNPCWVWRQFLRLITIVLKQSNINSRISYHLMGLLIKVCFDEQALFRVFPFFFC
jgi:hypothetical protein